MGIWDWIKDQIKYLKHYLRWKRHFIKSFIRCGHWDFFFDFNIEINTSCNRRCSYCPNSTFERGLIKNEKLMDVDVYHKLIDELAEVNFAGRISPHFFGEPLLDKRLTALMKYTREKLPKAKLVLTSNGDALSIKKFDELTSAGVDNFIITQHGESMSENMKLLFNYLNNSQKSIIEYIHFNSMTPLYNRGGTVKQEVLNRFPRCADLTNPVTIDYDGNVILCCNDYFSTIKFGNIKEQKLLDIWFSDKYKFLRKKLRKKQYRLPICLKCIGKI